MVPVNLSPECELTMVSGAVSAGTSAVNGTGVDMTGYESVWFICLLGDVLDTATLALKAQLCSDSSGTGAEDITGATTGTLTAGASNYDSKFLLLEVVKPKTTSTLKYVRCVLTRGVANAVVASIVAVQYGCKRTPVSQAGAMSNVIAD